MERFEQSANAMRGNAQASVVQPADPRLKQINNSIDIYAAGIRAHARDLNLKADAIVGGVRTGNQANGPEASPTPVPNGALEQIEMALVSLGQAVSELADAERRFGGLA